MKNGLKNIFNNKFDTESKPIFCVNPPDLSNSKLSIITNYFQNKKFQIHNINSLKLSNLTHLVNFAGENK